MVFLSKFPRSLLALWAEVDGSHLFAILYYIAVIRLMAELISPLWDFRILKGKRFLSGSRFISPRPDPCTSSPPHPRPLWVLPRPGTPGHSTRPSRTVMSPTSPPPPLFNLCVPGGGAQDPRVPSKCPTSGPWWSLADFSRGWDEIPRPPPRAVTWSEGSHFQAAETWAPWSSRSIWAEPRGRTECLGRAPEAGQSVWAEPLGQDRVSGRSPWGRTECLGGAPGQDRVSGQSPGAGQSVWAEAGCPLAAPSCIGRHWVVSGA